MDSKLKVGDRVHFYTFEYSSVGIIDYYNLETNQMNVVDEKDGKKYPVHPGQVELAEPIENYFNCPDCGQYSHIETPCGFGYCMEFQLDLMGDK